MSPKKRTPVESGTPVQKKDFPQIPLIPDGYEYCIPMTSIGSYMPDALTCGNCGRKVQFLTGLEKPGASNLYVCQQCENEYNIHRGAK